MKQTVTWQRLRRLLVCGTLLALPLGQVLATEVDSSQGGYTNEPLREAMNGNVRVPIGSVVILEGKQEDFDRLLHQGTGELKPLPGEPLLGAILASGKEAKLVYHAKEKWIGHDESNHALYQTYNALEGEGRDEEAQPYREAYRRAPSMSIYVDGNALDGAAYNSNYNNEYKTWDPETNTWKGPNYYGGNFTITDPILAKANEGAHIELTGENMGFQLLYAERDWFYRPINEDAVASSISVTLTGDLTANVGLQRIDSGMPDWVDMAHAGGRAYAPGTITTGTGHGHILVSANNIVSSEVRSVNDASIQLTARDKMSFTLGESLLDSDLNITANTVSGRELWTYAGGRTTIQADTVTIESPVMSVLPASELHITANQANLGKAVFASHGGLVDVTIGDNGTFTGSTLTSLPEWPSYAKEKSLNRPAFNQRIEPLWEAEESAGRTQGMVHITLGTDATWEVTDNSVATTVHNDGVINLAMDGSAKTLTTDQLSGTGTLHLHVADDGHSFVSTKEGTGTMTITIDASKEDMVDRVYPKTKVLTVEKRNGFTLLPGTNYDPKRLVSYVTPLTQDENNAYIEGRFQQVVNEAIPQVRRVRRSANALESHVVDYMLLSLYNEENPSDQGSWGHVGRSRTSWHGERGYESSVTVGLPIRSTKQSVWGTSYRYDRAHLTSDTSMYMHRVALYGERSWAHSWYLTGDVFMGRMTQTTFGQRTHRHVLGSHLELGQRITRGNLTMVPLVKATFAWGSGYTLTQEGYSGYVPQTRYTTWAVGGQVKYQASPYWQVTSQALYYVPKQQERFLHLSDGVDNVSVAMEPFQRGFYGQVGVAYVPSKNTQIALTLGRSWSRGVHKLLDIGIKGQFKF